MEKIKKISMILMLILILSIGFKHETYARIDCITNVTTSLEVKQGEELKVTIGISNIQGENGVLILGGRIEYDKNVLTLTERNAEGAWSLSYNKSNGKFVADRNDGFAKTNENVFTLTFKVNENANGNTTITVKDTAVSDANEEKTIGGTSKTVTIKAKNTNNPSEGNNQGGNQGGNGNQGGSSSQGENSSQGNSGNQSGSQNGNQNQGANQGNRPNNSNSNQLVNSNQGNGTSSNNEGNAKPEENVNNNQNSAITGIDTNRINEENTVKDNNPVVKKTDYISKEEPVKLYKQSDNFLIICIVCTVGVIAIIGIGIFAKKKLKK